MREFDITVMVVYVGSVIAAIVGTIFNFCILDNFLY